MDGSGERLAGGRAVVAPGRRRLPLAEASQSPCLSCSTSPCCTNLPIHSFTMTTLMDLDQARYLLNFDGIVLGLAASGEWSVYWSRPCRFLETRDTTCTIHGNDAQPNVCATYNPYTCWYKRAFDQPGSEFVWVDRQRLERIAEQVVFDEFRTIVEVPSWDSLVAEAAPPPPSPLHATPTGHPPTPVPLTLGPTRLGDPSADGPADRDSTAEPQSGRPRSFDSLRHPCTGCAAYCCTSLVFGKPTPTTNVELDFWRFCLGFPGIEVAIGPSGWQLVVSTTCRHLDDAHQCSVYGQPERPLKCSYYDAWKCRFKPLLGPDPQPGQHLMGLTEFDAYLATLTFDEAGTLL